MSKWNRINKDGLCTVELSSWKHFADFVNQDFLSSTEYIFRGHQDSNWKLESTFDRLIPINSKEYLKRRNEHLEKFKYFSRGRLKFEHRNQLISENDWWAIGQHNGLATPLLDWTESPFIAAYFAFQVENFSFPNKRVIYSIATDYITEHSDDKIELFYSHNDENPRLINQRGLFTITKGKIDIVEHINKNFKHKADLTAIYRIEIEEKSSQDRIEFLKFLNRMNINDLTLFPDLIGTGNYCNKTLMIEKY
ncbi:FRG domain-containing protein [Flavobacterium wongokense]|uniref:FRG domain-containing protein n=1 Tax=Flavobacterium wongokense TaxID=2910674 RepID=UPI001F220C38|nr:FRG domain-containing protein [Flavobacterium sp. WG47]MCF6132000.1 FRG domain-containing protein [Flavobacterium sp. WG47]